jgi:D-beta-D-heptose 7-phosphate kinase/D-beta-D-heptose 1-phosphate adenosyltransferase
MKKVVFTNGCFDILHVGHIKLLEECRKLSYDGTVIIGLNSDDSIKKLKGSSRPINDQYSRKTLLESIRFVDKVIIFEEDTPENLLSIVRPDVLVKGGDYSIEQIVGKQFANEVVIFSYLDGFSTTSTIRKISQNSGDR